MYNHEYSPDKVIRLDYGFGSDVDAVELGDGTLYLKVDLNTTWFGMPYKIIRLDYGFGSDVDAVELGDGTLYLKIDFNTTWACEVLSKYSMGFLVEDEMVMAANILKHRAFGVDKEK